MAESESPSKAIREWVVGLLLPLPKDEKAAQTLAIEKISPFEFTFR